MNLPICRIAVEASRYNRHSQQLGETVMAVYAVLIIFLVSYVVNKIDATSYASLSSADENFKLQWTYNSSKFIFKMTCKTTGWCAVGFTTTADGRGMVDYDIAVAGYASSAGYIDVSCIFVFMYVFGRGLSLRTCIQTQPLKHTAGRRLFKNVDF